MGRETPGKESIKLKRTIYGLATAVLAAGMLTACGGNEPEEKTSESSAENVVEKAPEPEPESEPEEVDDFDSEAATQELEETLYTANGEREISESCESDYTRWQCYFDSFDVPHKGRININLGFPSDVDEQALAEDARRWVNNMLLDNLPELDTIVTYDSNGRDLGTTNRG